MSQPVKHHFTDKDIQQILGTLLRIGVLSAMVVVLIGGVLFLFENYNHTVDYSNFKPESNLYSSMLAIIQGVKTFKSGAIIQFGILLLIFTPIMRVVFSIFSFLYEQDYLYVFIGLLVLGIILLSLNGGFAG